MLLWVIALRPLIGSVHEARRREASRPGQSEREREREREIMSHEHKWWHHCATLYVARLCWTTAIAQYAVLLMAPWGITRHLSPSGSVAAPCTRSFFTHVQSMIWLWTTLDRQHYATVCTHTLVLLWTWHLAKASTSAARPRLARRESVDWRGSTRVHSLLVRGEICPVWSLSLEGLGSYALRCRIGWYRYW